MSNYLDCDFHVCDRERAGVGIEERGEGDAKREYIRGHGAVFYDPKDAGTEYQLGRRIRERVAPTAFDGVLQRGDDVMALYNHDEDVLLARTKSGTLTLNKDARGLAYAFAYDSSDSDHKRIRSKMLRGDLSGSSFGFIAENERFEDHDDMIIRTLESVLVRDVAVVGNPAYLAADSSIGRRKQELFAQACAVYIGQNRDNAEVRRLEKRAATLFGLEIPADIDPGMPVEAMRRRLDMAWKRIRLGGDNDHKR